MKHDVDRENTQKLQNVLQNSTQQVLFKSVDKGDIDKMKDCTAKAELALCKGAQVCTTKVTRTFSVQNSTFCTVSTSTFFFNSLK